MTNIKTVSASLTSTGRKRQNNEDSLTYCEPEDPRDRLQSGNLYIVADGVGGAAKGERASRYAADKVLYDYYQMPDVPPGDRLRQLMREAGNQIYQYADGESFGRMATTMVAAVVRNNSLVVAHVGDSRVYLIRNGQVEQLTRDHSLVGEMIRDGSLTEEESLTAKIKNRLTRSLGGEENVPVDVMMEIPLEPGDCILLCSDGLTRYALPSDLLEMVPARNPAQAVQSLINFANDRGGADNITAIVISVHAEEEIVDWTGAEFHALTAPQPWEMETDPSAGPAHATQPIQPRQKRTTLVKWIPVSVIGLLMIIVVGFAANFAIGAAHGIPTTQTTLPTDIVAVAVLPETTATEMLPISTLTLTNSSTPAPTPSLTPIPISDVECTNIADLVTENPEDGHMYDPKTPFTKTWTLKNIGTCTWTTDYKLVFFEGDQMSDTAEIAMILNVAPQDFINLSVKLISPEMNGTYRGYWHLKNAKGELFNVGKANSLWVEISVNGGTTITSTPTTTGTPPVSQ